MKESKRELRIQMKKRVGEINPQARTEKSQMIAKHLENLLSHEVKDTDALGVYAPLQDEPHILSFLKQRGKFAFPQIHDFNSGEMVYCLSSENELIERQWGPVVLRQPKESSVQVTPQWVLVPGLAFDKQGYRLGRGKGFYDRYLASFSGRIIGLCFNEQLLNRLPTEDNDVPVHYLVTDRDVIEVAA